MSSALSQSPISPELTASWVWSISIGVGVTGIFLSWTSRAPIITAWSTPAAVFLVAALATTPYAEAVGAYVVSAAAFVALGLSGRFERVIRLIPPGVAAGLLAGVLLQFGVKAFGSVNLDPVLAGLLIATYLALKRVTARYAVLGVLVLGLAVLLLQNRIDLSALELKFAAPVFTAPVFTAPVFSFNALFSVPPPLFLITLTGQYTPGMLVLRNDGFKTSANPIVTVTGLGSLTMAPFGSHAFNLAAITAAISTGREAHEDPSKRWIAGVAAGVCYILVGVFGVTLASLFMALPPSFIATLAGLALLGAIGGNLAGGPGRSEDARSLVDRLLGRRREHHAAGRRRRLLGAADRPAVARRAQWSAALAEADRQPLHLPVSRRVGGSHARIHADPSRPTRPLSPSRYGRGFPAQP